MFRGDVNTCCAKNIDSDQNAFVFACPNLKFNVQLIPVYFALIQEDEAKALGAVPEIESDKEEAEANSDGESSDEMFGFGFGQPPKVKKPKVTQKTKSNSAAPNGGAGDLKSALTVKFGKAQELVETLGQFSAQALWQGSLKEKDVDLKLKKAMELSEHLSNDPLADDKCKTVASSLEKSSLLISGQVQLLTTFRRLLEGITPTNSADSLKIEEPVLTEFCQLPQDCITAVLTQIGRSLTEVGFMSKNGLRY